MKVAVVNIGVIVTGDWRSPIAAGDTIVSDGEHITLVGSGNGGTSANLANVVGPNLASLLELFRSLGFDVSRLLNGETSEDSTSQSGNIHTADQALVADKQAQ